MRKCLICGKEIKPPEPYCLDICSHECFIKYYWSRTLDNDALIIDGVCYHDGGFVQDESKVAFLGFGGMVFYIKKNTGEIIKTNNLWRNGDIPNYIKIKDNAKFIKEI